MKELLCHLTLPVTCGMAVIKVSDVSGKSLLCFTATICKMRVTFTSHWNVMKNSNCTVIWVWNMLWHILLRWEKSCCIQILSPTESEKLTQSTSPYRWDRISAGPVFPAAAVSWCWSSSLSLQHSSSSPECTYSHKGWLCVSAQALTEGPPICQGTGHGHTAFSTHSLAQSHFISTSGMGVSKLRILNF